MIVNWLQALLWAIQILVLGMFAYLWVPLLLRIVLEQKVRAIVAHDAALPARCTTNFAVLIPAHNEAAVIGELLASLAEQDYPRDHLAIFVVADNSHDATATLVRDAGIPCFERTSSSPSSKGQALAWLWAELQVKRLLPEEAVVVIIDADCILSPDYFTQLDRAFAGGANTVQSYRSIAGLGTSWLANLEAASEELRQQLDGAVRRLLGLSTYLWGSGIAFRRPIFELLIYRKEVWFSITEDMLWQRWIIQHNLTVVWWPNAKIWTEAVHSMKQFKRQRNRWVGDRIRGIVKWGFPLLWEGIRSANLTKIDQGWNKIQFPRSILGVLALLFFAVSLVWAGGSLLPWWGWLILLMGFGVYLIAGFLFLRAPLRVYASLLMLPLIIAQITLITLRTIAGRTTRQWEAIQHGQR